MATGKIKTSASLLLLFLCLLIIPLPSFSLSFSHYKILISLSQSLTTRVANLRASRGDYAGAARARAMAQKLEGFTGLGFFKFAWTMGWDYFRNYAWIDISSMSFITLASTVSDLNELLISLKELGHVDSETDRVGWICRNYRHVLAVSKSLFDKLLKVFRQSSPLREVVETMQKEVVEGDLLRDCLELGSNDLKGIIQVFLDFVLQYTGSACTRTEL